ncbi:serine/threonine-protein kinase pim-1-like isoform X2 [Anguilla anguilla]|uniref:serine/threonine-protein kinase pim-1-like isoform X2 n=1 Tax=Anguilla anguilla TaxID=7936 RepID=UPI0015A7CE68|nr:serine/threonine-protein kinase pim-1-like isoform X2 [Anguilla anguilla]
MHCSTAEKTEFNGKFTYGIKVLSMVFLHTLYVAGHVEDYYTKGSLLGEGGCGSVYAGTRISDGLPVALKYVAKVEEDLLLPGQEVRTPREVRLMGLVNENTGHPNILRLYEWFDAPDCYVMVLERPDPCKDLVDFCDTQNKKVMDEQQARAVIDQLLHALLHCQHAGVFHRDVKPTNILINTETLRVILIDFGCGTSWKDTPFSSFAGTTDFSPPEWFEEGLYQAGPFTVWSLGVTVFDIVCGYLPFNPDDGHESMSRVHFPTGLSSEIKDFMSRCLAPEVNERATLEELQRHPWLHPTCLQQGFRKRKMRREEDGEQKRSSSDSLIPAKCLRKDQDEWLQLLVSPTPGGEGQGHEGKGLSEHGPQAPVLSLGQTEDDHLSHGQSSEQFLSACSSLRSYYSCQSTERRGMNEETGVKSHRENQEMAANCLTKASEKPQKAGVRKRKMGCEEQAVVQGKNLGPYSGTRPAKCPRKDLQDMGQMMHYSASMPRASRTMNPMSSWGG